MLSVESPTKVYLDGFETSELLKHLEYQDLRVNYELQKFKQNKWYIRQYGEEAYQDKLQELTKSLKKNLLLKQGGRYYTYSGLARLLASNLQSQLKWQIKYPDPRPLPWHKPLNFQLRPYQNEAIEKFLEIRHGYGEYATGLGKTAIILMLAKTLGLKTLVLAPSLNIAAQLINLFNAHLGKQYVGAFFGSKKESNKLITIGIGQSLTKVKSGSQHFENFEKVEVFISDEAHTLPATTFEYVCMSLVANAPYRFFLTGTALRNDGLDLLLKGIIGTEVASMSLQDGIQRKYLAKPQVVMVSTQSSTNQTSDDVNKMTRYHLYQNPAVNRAAAQLANKSVEHGKSVLILIDEFNQFNQIYPHLKYPVAFAHGPAGKDVIPAQFAESNTPKLVEEFNQGKWPILIGTSAVSTGTDFKRNQTTIYLVGGKSEIQVRQGAIGRSTRLMPEVNKDSCLIFDFDVVDIPILHKHAQIRRKIYEREIGTAVSSLKVELK